MKQAEKLEGASLDAPKIFGGARAMPSRETIRYSPSHQSLIATRFLPFTIRYSLPFYQSPFTICHSLFCPSDLPICRPADLPMSFSLVGASPSHLFLVSRPTHLVLL
jgi:hypothetical protein